MRVLKKTLAAEEDLINIWSYTCETWGERQAEQYLDSFSNTFKQLLHTPEMARLRTEFRPPVRIHPHRHHLIIYMADHSEVNVIRVLHECVNIEDQLAD